jgi:phospholipid/cholesterol/gamma-HCH transport system substrate-binding protein
MSTASRRRALSNLLALAVMFAAGIVAAAYVLLHERLSVPVRSTYDISAQLTAADGVVPGLGQPVNVAGVQVGSIAAAHVASGLAVVTLQLNRGQVPHVYADADVTLAPVTPLGDVEIDLSPGAPPAAALAPGATVPVSQSTSPVVLEDLMSNLDGDTRSWLGSLIASLGQGTAGQGPDIRSVLTTLGPSADQVRQIAGALATRRTDLAHLVHDLAIVTRSATEDHALPQLVLAGDQTLHALASQATALGRATTLLPGSLQSLDSTLADLKGFSDQLTPTLTRLLPAITRLPDTLAAVRPFAASTARALQQRITPFVVKAAPLVSVLGPATAHLATATPLLTSSLQVFTYATNELAYNPNTANQGYLYWMDWFFHNWNSVFSSGDANGVSPRADVLANCNIVSAAGAIGHELVSALGLAKLC